jgi:4-hydroxy-2-oxoglutarate aldolase
MNILKDIIVPITTPFKNDEVAFDKLKSNIEKLNEINLAGYVVLGSNGESVFLTKEEKLRMISSIREHAFPNKVIIAGTGTDSIKETISLTNDAANKGVGYALIITPSFFKSSMEHSTFINYYLSVADSVKIPVLIYNVPKFTNVNIHLDTVAELSEHNNIVGIKNSSGDTEQTAKFISDTTDDFHTFVGTGSVLLQGLKDGADGGILALANIAPKECIRIQKLFNLGKLEEAEVLQKKMVPVNTAITSTFGVAGLKATMDMIGLYGGNPRLPLNPLDEKAKLELKNILIKASLIESKIRN